MSEKLEGVKLVHAPPFGDYYDLYGFFPGCGAVIVAEQTSSGASNLQIRLPHQLYAHNVVEMLERPHVQDVSGT